MIFVRWNGVFFGILSQEDSEEEKKEENEKEEKEENDEKEEIAEKEPEKEDCSLGKLHGLYQQWTTRLL